MLCYAMKLFQDGHIREYMRKTMKLLLNNLLLCIADLKEVKYMLQIYIICHKA